MSTKPNHITKLGANLGVTTSGSGCCTRPIVRPVQPIRPIKK
jgi:hypothetical protein